MLEGARLAVHIKGQGRQRDDDGEVGTEGEAVNECQDLADVVEYPKYGCSVAVVDVALLDKVAGELQVVTDTWQSGQVLRQTMDMSSFQRSNRNANDAAVSGSMTLFTKSTRQRTGRRTSAKR